MSIAVWVIICVVSLFLGCALAFLALSDLTDKHVEILTSYESVPRNGKLLYPTITICPVQFYDRWNLQKALLNKIQIADSDGKVQARVWKDFKVNWQAISF